MVKKPITKQQNANNNCTLSIFMAAFSFGSGTIQLAAKARYLGSQVSFCLSKEEDSSETIQRIWDWRPLMPHSTDQTFSIFLPQRPQKGI